MNWFLSIDCREDFDFRQKQLKVGFLFHAETEIQSMKHLVNPYISVLASRQGTRLSRLGPLPNWVKR